MKQHLSHPGPCLSVLGGGGNLRSCSPFGESDCSRSQRFGGRDLDAPALPAGSRCLWSWGVPGQRGELPAGLGFGSGEAGCVLGQSLWLEKPSGLVWRLPAGLLTSLQVGLAFGKGSDAPWGQGEPCGGGCETAARRDMGEGERKETFAI